MRPKSSSPEQNASASKKGLPVFVGEAGGVGRDDEFEGLGAFAVSDGVAGAFFLACFAGGTF